MADRPRPADSMQTALGAIRGDEGFRALAEALRTGHRAVATGAVGSSTTLVAAALALELARPVVLLVAHADDAEHAADELHDLLVPCALFPALEALPGETGVAPDLFLARLEAARVFRASAGPSVFVAPIAALMQGVPNPEHAAQLCIRVSSGMSLRIAQLTDWLASRGYTRTAALEQPGEFAVRGGIVDVFSAGALCPIRLDFDGDRIETVHEIDLDTMGSDRRLDAADLVAADLSAAISDDTECVLAHMPTGAVAVLSETLEIVEQGRGSFERAHDSRGLFGPPSVLKLLEQRAAALAEINHFSGGALSADVRVELPVRPLPAFDRDAAAAVAELGELAGSAARAIVPCRTDGERTRLLELIRQFVPDAEPRVEAAEAFVHRGFVWGHGRDALAVVPHHELFHRYDARGAARAGRGVLRSTRALDTFLDFEPGDVVVHAEHGLAIYRGLTTMGKPARPTHDSVRTAREASAQVAPQQEYLTLEFAGAAKLHVPAMQIDLVQRYVGASGGKPTLSTIGGTRWRSQKERAAEGVRDLAAEMLRVRAARQASPGVAFPGDTPWQREFEAEFPYQETEDQLAALAEIKRDMTSPRPMDRLLCGDVGFGKTELAVRAAFKAVEFGKQVAILVPTTVLAEQHERTFRSRFADYPFRVESLSRFKSASEASAILKEARQGKVDILIGTHRLLSKDVRFADLGLVVVDEEQRFGVEHKERLLQFRLTVDVLTLSATPIPRTLNMALIGLRDISSLTTPPLDRRAIVTDVAPLNERRIAQAIARELAREGQVFFVHNRVHNIRSVADRVRQLAPSDARVVVGHGQMAPAELEDVMLRFMRREADILVCTTIIESGIDIPSANTMIINDADRFGLAELHQLRGRVGRSKHRAYCYLLLPADRPVNDVAQKRLRALEEYSMLGAGFKIAMRDLEIRGAGNLLGAEQSGHIAAVGYDMFCRLLERAVHELTREPHAEPPSATSVEIGLIGLIPRAYIPSDQRRLEAYRRLATAAAPDQLETARRAMIQAYGEPAEPVLRLFELAALRIAAAALHVRALTLRAPDVVLRTRDPAPVAEALRTLRGSVRVLPPKSHDTLHEVYYRPPEQYLEARTLCRVLTKALGAAAPTRPPAEVAT